VSRLTESLSRSSGRDEGSAGGLARLLDILGSTVDKRACVFVLEVAEVVVIEEVIVCDI
jgi:hypothetical protein